MITQGKQTELTQCLWQECGCVMRDGGWVGDCDACVFDGAVQTSVCCAWWVGIVRMNDGGREIGYHRYGQPENGDAEQGLQPM